MIAEIRLNKRNKTIKVVNRKQNLRLQHTGRTGPQGSPGDQGPQGDQGLQGLPGDNGQGFLWQGPWNDGQAYQPQGSPGMADVVSHNGSTYVAIMENNIGHEPGVEAGWEDWWAVLAAAGLSTFVRVHHGSDPDVPRPDALYVEWVGSVAPNNATIEDTWIDTQ